MDIKIIQESVDQLLDRSKIHPLEKLVHFGKNKATRYQKELIENAGLYAFWLDNTTKIVEDLHRTVSISGPNQKINKVEWNWSLDDKQILLYVGKSTNIKKRISQHLKLGTLEWINKNNNTLNKVTTTCQVRSGIEHLIQNTKCDVFDFLNQFVRLSFIEVSDFQNRFFAENLAIGNGKPWFNLDSER